MTFGRGPHVQIAAFSESVLEEADGVLSVIRIFDRINRTWEEEAGPPPTVIEPFPHEITYTVLLKAGEVRGEHLVKVEWNQAGEDPRTLVEQVVLFEAERGVTVRGTATLLLTPGMHWMVVYFDEAEIVRSPLRVSVTV